MTKNKNTTHLQNSIDKNFSFLKTALSIIPEAVVMIENRIITYVSPRAMEFFGITDSKAVLGKSTRIFYFNDDDFQNFGKQHYDQVKKEGFASGIITIKRLSDGSPLQIAMYSKPTDKTCTSVVSVFKEDTSTVMRPGTLYQPTKVDFNDKISEFSQILDSLNMAVLTMDATGTVDYCNSMMNDILADYPAGRGTKCFELCEHIWSESRDNFCSWCGIKEVFATGKATETIVKAEDGKQWLFSWAPIWGEGHTVKKVVKTVGNITAQMNEKQYLESLLFDIFSAMPNGIVVLNSIGQIIFINTSMENRWGLKYNQVAMTKLAELEIYPDSTQLDEAFSQSKKGGQSLNMEMEVERHDGRLYWVTVSLIPIKDKSGDWQVILFENDLTELSKEKKQVEENLVAREKLLVEQEKLAAVGQLAAGIAHELNTPTTYIRGNMQTFDKYTKIINDLTLRLQSDTPQAEQDAARHKLDKIIRNMKEIANSSFEGTSRLMNIISSMKTFVRQSSEGNSQINIYEPIKDGLVLVFNRLKHIGVATVNGRLFKPGMEDDKSVDPVMITGSAMRLSQLLIILLNNAIDAWQDRVDMVEERSFKLEITVTKDHTMTKIQVCDNAGGIPEEIQNKIFEPFYTSKAVNVGTGLGLSIARQIAAEHNGTLTLENRLGDGACFILEIRNQKSEIRNQKSEIRNQKSEIRNQKSE